MNAICALEDLYARTAQHEKRVVVLKKHAENASNMIDQKDLYYQIAELQEKSLNQVDAAIQTYQSILDLDAEDQVALDALELLYQKTENWNELILIYKRKIDAATDSDSRVALGVKVACVYCNKLNDVDSAIENYVQALNENPDNLEILNALEELYGETKRYDDLLEILQNKADYAGKHEDSDLKHNTELKMANILIDDLNDNARAIEVLHTILQDDESNQDAIDLLNKLLANDGLVGEIASFLMPIYKNCQKDAEYVGLCERQIQVSSDDFEKRSLYLDAANVADEKLNDADKAFGFIAPALLASPTDDEIIELAEKVTAHHECYGKMTELCEKVIGEANDPDATVKLSLIAARYYEQNLNDTDKTIVQFERVMDVDPLHESALENLHRLYKQTNQKEKLASILQRRVEAGAQPLNEIRFELVELKLESEPAAALELLKQILWEEADNENALHALEKLLCHKELTLDIAEFLEPYYTKTGENRKLVELLQAKVDMTEDPSDALMLLKQIAKLELEVLNDNRAAFATYVKALSKDPSDTEVLTAIEKIAEELGLWNELAQAYGKAIEAASDDSEKLVLYAKQAHVLAEHLENYEDAKVALNAIIEIDPENLDALHALESIYAKQGDNENLLNIKSRVADLTFVASDQKMVLYQCADLALNTLGQNERGMGFLERIIEIDDRAVDAIDPLLVLYSEAGAFDKYVDLLNKKLLTLSEDSDKLDVLMKIAQTNEVKLNDPAAAIDAYRSALEIRHDPQIYSALENIFVKHEQYQDLDDLYLAQIDDADDPKQKAAIRIKRAHIAAANFNDDLQAIDLLKEALADDPSSVEAFNALDEIYSRNGNFEELFELLKEQKEKATTEDAVLSYNIRIAKLAATHLGDPDKAIESLTEVIQVQPGNLEAIDSLIEIYEQQKSFDLAMGMLNHKLSCLQTDEDKSELHCHLARLLKTANWDVSQIEENYNAALRCNPKNEQALDALLDIAKNANNTSRQIELLNIRADNQTDDEARNKILLEIADVADTDADCAPMATAALAKVYASRPDDIDLGERLVNAYIKCNQTEQATQVLNTIIENLSAAKQNKRLPPFYSLKGRILKLNGDIAGARQAFEAASAIDKNNIPNNLELGILLYESGDYENGLKTMTSLLLQQMNIKDKAVKTKIFYYLGMLRVKTNDPKRAKDMFNRALSVDPNHEPTKEALANLG